MSVSSGMLLARLKQHTRAHHERIEADLNPLAPDFGLSDYRALLCRFFGYYSPWEREAGRTAPDFLEGRGKSQKLIADLEYMGASPADISRLALCDTLPPLDTQARILGSMYVLEGATLGGQILRRHFTGKFGFEADGCAFFSGYADQTGPMWKRFSETVNAAPPEEWDAIVESAVATFETMHAWLICESASNHANIAKVTLPQVSV